MDNEKENQSQKRTGWYPLWIGTHQQNCTVRESIKFRVNVGTLKTTNILSVNKEFYFYPQEAVGVGTVGTGSTITFENPGVGVTQKFIPTKQIYIPDHGLEVNGVISLTVGHRLVSGMVSERLVGPL